MNNTLRLLPHRWFAPREAALRASTAAAIPVHDEIDKIFQEMFSGMVTPWEAMDRFLPTWRDRNSPEDLMPSMDLTSDEKSYSLRMELPGVEPENVSVAVRDNALVVSGEKKRENEDENRDQHVLERVFGSFQRVLSLPDDADVEGIAATHKNGVLSVTIPRKVVDKAAAKNIAITKA